MTVIGDTMEESLNKQNLSEWIYDDKKLVTYHFLSITLGVHVNLAKQMLYEFYKEELAKCGPEALEAMFYVSGIQKTTAQEIDPNVSALAYTSALCTATKLDDLKKQFSKIYSIHIYSVKHIRSKDTLDKAAEQTLELTNDGHAGPEYGPFKLIKPQPNQRKPIELKKPVETKHEEPKSKLSGNKAIKSEPMEEETQKSSGSKKEAQTRLSSDKLSSVKSEGDVVSKADKKSTGPQSGTGKKKESTTDGKDRLKNMFAAAAAKPREIKKERSPPMSTNGTKGKDTSRKRPISSTARSTNSKQKSKAKQKQNAEVPQRRRIKVLSSSSEESDSSSNSDKSDEESESESPIPKRRQIKSDTESENEDFQELHPAKEKPKSEEKPTLPPCKPGRKRVTKTITKRVVDEEGYTVIKKEQVVVSESESDSEENKVNNSEKNAVKAERMDTKTAKTPVKNKPSESTPTSKRSNNTQQSMNGKPKQASITSFFHKKA